MSERVDHPVLVWQCQACRTETPLNMAHPRVASGAWRPGSKVLARCAECARTCTQRVVCRCPQCETPF